MAIDIKTIDGKYYVTYEAYQTLERVSRYQESRKTIDSLILQVKRLEEVVEQLQTQLLKRQVTFPKLGE